MSRDSFAWPKSWPDVTGPNQRLLLIWMCVKADDQGELIRTRKELASFPDASVTTIDTCITTLELTDCLLVVPASRDDLGSFCSNKYVLRLENPRMRAMFEFWRPASRRTLGGMRSGPSIGPKGSGQLEMPATDSGRPLQETHSRPYKDSRASSSSSSSFPPFPHSVVIQDALLRSRVLQAWSVIGEGADPDKIYDLAHSLIIEIPKAIAEGYEFEEDILSCLREATSYYRTQPLFSFKVLFQKELPVVRVKRLRKLSERQPAKG